MIKFIDLFAGIGGFHIALHNLGARCVFATEINKQARKTYELNFKDISATIFADNLFAEDITKVQLNKIPEFDILCAGFPCQPFSQAGYKKGFQDLVENRGNMFFELVKIIKAKKPGAYFLENVKHLQNHDNGKTFFTIKTTLENLGYSFHASIIKASDYGLPQHRQRLYMVGFRDEVTGKSGFKFPPKQPLKLTMSDILKGNCDKTIGYTLRVGGRASGIRDRRNWDTYILDGSEVRITSKEGKRMMGFPDDFNFPVSETQAMKQLGNSVAIPAIQATAKEVIDYLKNRL